MAKRSAFGRGLRRGLLVVLVALAGAIVYLLLFRGPAETQSFGKIYQASVRQASANLRLTIVLGTPVHADKEAAQYDFFNQDGRRHVRFHFPIRGTHRTSVIVGEAVMLGHNWLLVRLVATFPRHTSQINLLPGILT